jgi:glycosyltransferase involved in cell wall biosynthesis
MRWLIVEDALRDRKGHWFEYLGTFARELKALGDEVTILGDRAAEPFLREQLQVQPVLPESIWHRMGDGAGPLRRYLRVPVHAWNTFRTMKKFLARGEKFDLIFVPTVLVHHLLGWQWLIKHALKNSDSRVLLFFPNTPVTLDEKTGEPAWQTAPTAKLFNRLIRSLHAEVAQGRVILGAETHPMCDALAKLTEVKFTYLPHPVAPLSEEKSERHGADETKIIFGSYGSARHEKGPDVLVPAVEEFCRRFPETRARFVLQSVDGDKALWARLANNPKVELVENYFPIGGYAKQLRATDVLLLPYRRSSYALRVSRVVIEALVQGLPVVATSKTTLEDQAKEFGAANFCADGDVESLVQAIRETENNIAALKQIAAERKAAARKHFSVQQFRATLTA